MVGMRLLHGATVDPFGVLFDGLEKCVVIHPRMSFHGVHGQWRPLGIGLARNE
jgi:hypothetical protein